ncbi:alpha/beta-hydrolase [Gautieria morchelliformis]|nr:alpha/beta-hydrolase [Gautieria morchelliformis]
METKMGLGIAAPIAVKFDQDISSSLKTLLRSTDLPSEPPIPTVSPWTLGVHLPWLSKLKLAMQADDWTVHDLERRINQWPNYIARMKAMPDIEDSEEVDIHFVHVKSLRTDAVPLMLLHGWPGTFWDFHKVVEPLVNPPDGEMAFHIVLPSLPGYFLSTYPQRYDWSLVDSARLLHTLMTEVLGYTRYAGQGGDWGSYILRVIGTLYPSQAPVLHFNMFRCPPVPGINPETFTTPEKGALQRNKEFMESGRGYNAIQSTKPFTIGLAISTSPVALLAYIGEKMYAWSDPTTLDQADVLDTVALYYLTRCFPTSVMIYHQSKKHRDEMTSSQNEDKWKVRSRIGFTLFPYEIGALPRAYIKAVGPLVFYKERSVGGHFPALDNPDGLVEDLRKFIGENWAAGA